jgi:hypothetical protein
MPVSGREYALAVSAEATGSSRPICDARHPRLLAVKLPAVTGNSGSTPVVSGSYVHAEALSDFLTAFEPEIV